jgi:hypothetical protein
MDFVFEFVLVREGSGAAYSTTPLSWAFSYMCACVLSCHRSVQCVSGRSLEYGYSNFDNIGLASLTILTVISLEGWTAVMYQLNHTWGIPAFTTLYFLTLVMFGSFFMLNLALAVIWAEYAKADEVLESQVRGVPSCPRQSMPAHHSRVAYRHDTLLALLVSLACPGACQRRCNGALECTVAYLNRPTNRLLCVVDCCY